MTPVDSSGGLQHVLALRKQIVERNQALQQLRTPDTVDPAKREAEPSSSTTTSGFSDTLNSALSEVNAAQRRASELAAAYERGEVTDIAQVMIARQESGIAFEATLQVRNKLLTAYQEIMRMGA